MSVALNSSRSFAPLVRRGFASSVKAIAQGNSARQQILKGCDILADTVGVTLGPRGRNVIIEQQYGSPKITKDGVTVARNVEVQDKLQNVGVSLIKGVAQAANDASGDGTTTATVLARAIYKGGCEAVAAGLNPMEVLKGMKLATDQIRKYLLDRSKPISERADIFHVAKVSANGDDLIGNLISTAMEKVGRDGTITVSEGKMLTHELSLVEGYEFDRGFVAPYFMTNTKTQKCELENPLILIVDEKIASIQSLVPVLETVLQNSAELLIVAEDIDSEVLATLVVNKLRGGLKVCAVKAPGFGDNRKRQLEDLAALTGGTVVTKDAGRKLEAIKINDLGKARKVIVSKDNTLILEGNANRQVLQDRVHELKYQLEDPDLSDYEKTKLQERLGKLAGGVAVIQVGGASELEVAEAKDRLDDALNATRAAVESGVLPGGGTALLYAADHIKDLKAGSLDQDTGIQIIRSACAVPCKLIAANAGHEGAIVAGNLLRDHTFGSGFDATTGKYVNMLDSGILDPTRVVVTALTDASSVASLMCTTEGAIYSLPEATYRQQPNNDLEF